MLVFVIFYAFLNFPFAESPNGNTDGFIMASATSILSKQSVSFTTTAAPVLSRQPQNATLLSNRTLTIPCQVTAGAPFPDVVWTRDGVAVNYTQRVFLPRYSASLQFESLLLEDSGEYACYVENVNGSAQSDSGFITILGKILHDLNNYWGA